MKTLVLLCFCGLFAFSQPALKDPDADRWQLLTYDMASIFRGIGYSYARPLHWQNKQWSQFGATLGATGLAYLVDGPTSTYFREIKQDVPKFIRDYGFEYGSPANNYLLTGGVYVAGLVAKDPKLRRTGVLLIASASAAGLLQQILKSAIGRARPVSGEGKATFKPLWAGNRQYHSMPSGHTILAMTNAHAIAKQFKNPWVKAGIYTVGAIPAISRLWEGKHWLSDIVMGAAISILTVESIDRYLDTRYNEKYNDQKKAVHWDINLGLGQVGLVLEFQ